MRFLVIFLFHVQGLFRFTLFLLQGFIRILIAIRTTRPQHRRSQEHKIIPAFSK